MDITNSVCCSKENVWKWLYARRAYLWTSAAIALMTDIVVAREENTVQETSFGWNGYNVEENGKIAVFL